MTSFEALALWVGLHVLLMAGLKLRVGATRIRTKVDYGGGEDALMQRMLRVQGNAVEDVPIALLGLGALAFAGGPVWMIHMLGGLLFAARSSHAFGLGGKAGASKGRFIGTVGSLLVLLLTGGACLYFAFF